MPKFFSDLDDAPSRSLKTPRLPHSVAETNEEEQYEAIEIFDIMRTQGIGGKHFKALSYPFSRARRQLYELSCSPSEADNMYLRSSLISMMQNWQTIIAGRFPCPIGFLPEEQAECLRLEEAQQEADAIQHVVEEALETDPDGWVPNNQDERVTAGLAAFKDEALEAAEFETDRNMIMTHWPWKA